MPLITAANSVFVSSITDQSSYTTGTYTPTAPGLVVYIAVNHTQAGTGIADATSITGTSITNVQKVATVGYNSAAASTAKIELWVATSTATAGAVTVNLPGTPTAGQMQVCEMTGVFPSGTTYPGIVQVATVAPTGNFTVMPAPLQRPFGSQSNATFAIFGFDQQAAFTAKTGWTTLRSSSISAPVGALHVEWINRADTNPTSTNDGSGTYAAIAIEIAGTPVRSPAIQETLLGPSTPYLLPTERLIRPASQVVLGTITGTLATTNANDTSAAAGTTTVTGTLAKTNANDTSAAAGTTTVTGALARTNANDTLAASGSVGSPVSGTLATTNANDTSVGAGTTKILGTSATTNANDTLSASGVVGTPVVAPPVPPQQVGGTLSGRRGPYTAVDAELEAILRDDEEILVLL